MELHLIHFEHAVEPLADLGLEHVVTPVFKAVLAGNKVQLSEVFQEEVIANLMRGLAKAGNTRALRRLIAVISTPWETIYDDWEQQHIGENEVLRAVAGMQLPEVQEVVVDFFEWLGLSPNSSPNSSGNGEEGKDQLPESSDLSAPSGES